MDRRNAFATIDAARSLRQRHPDVKPSVYTVALVLSSFADGKTGRSIRPGVGRLVELTGFHSDTVQDAIEWLVARGELRRDKKGFRGSAACFTWVGGMEGSHTPAIEDGAGMQGSETPTTSKGVGEAPETSRPAILRPGADGDAVASAPRRGGRRRVYATNAARQAAYRQRKAERESRFGGGGRSG
jgi:hypothetical protein